MCFGDMGNTVLKYMFLETFDINMCSIWIWILLAIYKVEGLKYAFLKGFDINSILICTRFGFGFTYDDK